MKIDPLEDSEQSLLCNCECAQGGKYRERQSTWDETRRSGLGITPPNCPPWKLESENLHPKNIRLGSLNLAGWGGTPVLSC